MKLELQEILPTQNWGLPLDIFRSRVPSGYGMHWHTQTELLFVEAGSADFGIGNEMLHANAGDLIIIGENELHYFPPSDLSFIGIHLSSAFFDNMNFSGVKFHHLLCGNEKVKELFMQMTERIVRKNPGDDFFIMSRVYELFSLLIGMSQVYRLSQREQERTLNRDRIMTQVISYIEVHYAEDITTSSLAEMLFLSEAYFCRFFKTCTGESPMNYLHRFRVGKASVMLSESNKSITDIATSVGFSDSNYFSRVFRSFFGKSPTAYRADNCNDITAGIYKY